MHFSYLWRSPVSAWRWCTWLCTAIYHWLNGKSGRWCKSRCFISECVTKAPRAAAELDRPDARWHQPVCDTAALSRFLKDLGPPASSFGKQHHSHCILHDIQMSWLYYRANVCWKCTVQEERHLLLCVGHQIDKVRFDQRYRHTFNVLYAHVEPGGILLPVQKYSASDAWRCFSDDKHEQKNHSRRRVSGFPHYLNRSVKVGVISCWVFLGRGITWHRWSRGTMTHSWRRGWPCVSNHLLSFTTFHCRKQVSINKLPFCNLSFVLSFFSHLSFIHFCYINTRKLKMVDKDAEDKSPTIPIPGLELSTCLKRISIS